MASILKEKIIIPKDNLILTIALTGNIGSGKTEAAKIFSQLGAKVYYADSIAKELMVSNAPVKKLIQTGFGKESYLPDGSLNRSHLADAVFSDAKKREQLNSIVHPAVTKELKKIIEKERRAGKCNLLIVEAALIYEAGIEEMFDYVIVVRADESRCIERIEKRDKASRGEILNRMKAQMDSKKKEAKADFVIDNSGDIEALREKCRFIYTLMHNVSQHST